GDRAHAGRGGVAEHRDVLRLLDQHSVGGVDAEREVATLDEQRRPRTALDDDAHALADRLQPAGDDRGEDRVAHAFLSRTKLPERSTERRKPSGTTTVVVASSTTAGPSSSWPGSIRPPSRT